MCVCGVSVCVSMHHEDQNTLFISKVRTFLGGEDIFAGPHSIEGMFEDRLAFKFEVKVGCYSDGQCCCVAISCVA